MRTRSNPLLRLDSPARAARNVAAGILLLVLLAGCDRNIEPFVEGEEPRAPDLARIFPEESRDAKPGPSSTSSPGAGPPAAPQRGTAPKPGIRGTIAVSPELAANIPATGTLFVIARQSGVAAGPPMAVLRIPGPQFPMSFEIGQAQVMIPGVQFQGQIQITARLDSDGNATTKLAGDLSGAARAPASPGTDGLTIVLDSSI